ncbi:MAG: 50S ribosomal protein L14 [Thermoplasmata archaeon]|nr:50S ribosomal protein L14 [Thermoplasmata archaeon]
MKAIPGRNLRGLPVGARLECVDNTGAKELEIIMVPNIKGVHRRVPSAGVGDRVIVSVKKGKVELRKQVFHAVIVRQRRPFRRPSGVMVQFEDNAAVLITPTGDMKGSMIKGPVALEAAERWPKIAAAASMIV